LRITLQQGVKLYKAVLLPKLTYASSFWFRTDPEHGNKVNSRETTKILEATQKEALRVLTGAWCTTALAAIEVETNTMPITLYIQQRNENVMHRIRGSEMYQAITQDRGSRTDKRQSATPLQALEREFAARNPITNQETEQVELILVKMTSPWWKPPETHIAASKEGAI
jgi:hypothetical protein